mgnify:FL=1
MELTIKLNFSESQRKKAHKKQLELAIAGTHSDIVLHTLNGDYHLAELKAKLFLKYNRRLKYLGL